MAEAADNASLSSVGGKDAGYLIEFCGSTLYNMRRY